MDKTCKKLGSGQNLQIILWIVPIIFLNCPYYFHELSLLFSHFSPYFPQIFPLFTVRNQVIQRFTGTYEDNKGQGELVEVFGFGVAVVDDQLRLGGGAIAVISRMKNMVIFSLEGPIKMDGFLNVFFF